MPTRPRRDSSKNNDQLLSAIGQADNFLKRAERFQRRIQRIADDHGMLFPVGVRTRFPFEAAEPPPNDATDAPVEPNATTEAERQERIDQLEKQLKDLDASIKSLGGQITEMKRQDIPGDPASDRVQALGEDFGDFMKEVQEWRNGQVNELTKKEPDATPSPDDWSVKHLKELERMIDGFLAEPDAPKADTDVRREELRKAVEERERPEPKPEEPQPAPEPSPEPPPAPKKVEISTDMPWPKNAEEFREQFTYTPEKYESPDKYLDYLAQRLDTDDKVNEFLERMFVYTDKNDVGRTQRFINRDRTEKDEHWSHPATFLTTYNADGKIEDDCDGVAAAFNEVIGRRGIPTFAIETYTAKKEGAGIRADGHQVTGWIETDKDGNRVAKMIDTTGIAGKTQALLQTATAKPGETDEQLFARLYEESHSDKEQLDVRAIQSTFAMKDGEGYSIPGNLSFARRYGEVKTMLEAKNYPGVRGVIEQEIAKDPTNLNLRMAQIQFMLLAKAPRAQVTVAVDKLKAPPPPAEKANQKNIYDALCTYNLLLNTEPKYIAEARDLPPLTFEMHHLG